MSRDAIAATADAVDHRTRGRCRRVLIEISVSGEPITFPRLNASRVIGWYGPRGAGVGNVSSGAHAHGRQAGAGQAPPGATVAAVGPEGPRASPVVTAAQQQAHLLQR